MSLHANVNALFNNVPTQRERANKDQVRNNAGGYVYEADKWTVLNRFLIMGTENNTYYSTAKQLTIENTRNLLDCIKEDGLRTVSTIVSISDADRAVKNDFCIFALAVCVCFGDAETKRAALDNMNTVVRTGTHLFAFIDYIDAFIRNKHNTDEKCCGWGRSIRNAFANWYNSKSDSNLVYTVTKYKNRNKWSHYDVLNLAHPKPKRVFVDFVFNKIVNGFVGEELAEAYYKLYNGEASIIHNNWHNDLTPADIYAIAANANYFVEGDIDKMVALIKKLDFPRELVPTEMLTNGKIWSALLEAKMPMTAMLRNLSNMAKAGILTPFSKESKIVIDAINSAPDAQIRRIHPINILCAKLMYENGVNNRTGATWDVNPKISEALEDYFYKSFDYLTPTNLRYMLAIDISGSMDAPIPTHKFITSSEAIGAMAMSIVKAEENALVGVFDTQFSLANINKRSNLNDMIGLTDGWNFGGTDIASVTKYMVKNNIDVDVIFIGSDGETWAGDEHVDYSVNKYRNKVGHDVKVIFANTVPNRWSLTNIKSQKENCNPNYLDIAGFDASLPQLVQEFVLGNI